MENQLQDLPADTRRILVDFVDVAREACGENLSSVVLFGSAAEGRLRAASDVNLILVLKEFQSSEIDRLRESLRLAHAAIRLNVMFILDSEITTASEAFAVKFNDILHRHRVLLGTNPFRDLKISRSATLQRLRQVIVNLKLRLRERYALVSLREEQLNPIIADAAGPIRAIAATILELEGKGEHPPKEALQALVRDLPQEGWDSLLSNLSAVREERELAHGEAAQTLFGLLRLLQSLHERVQGIK
jgi:predicted nucleotidyltransferase